MLNINARMGQHLQCLLHSHQHQLQPQRRLRLKSNYCCNNPDVGSNQYFSCSQACMVRYYGASQQECLNLVNTQAKERGCSRSFGAHSFSFCQRCADLTSAPQCKWGVQNGEPSQTGCTLDIKAPAAPPAPAPAPPVADKHLLAYWDSGNCGPMGNDYQWDWCGRTAFSCKDTLSTPVAPAVSPN